MIDEEKPVIVSASIERFFRKRGLWLKLIAMLIYSFS